MLDAKADASTDRLAADWTLWAAAGFRREDIQDWWAAGCWHPDAARALIDAGLSPHQLVDSDRRPITIDALSGVPVATAVADEYITAEQAADVVRARCTLRWTAR